MNITKTNGQGDSDVVLDCIVMYEGERVTSGITWVDRNGTVLSDNDHLEITLQPGQNFMKCKFQVDGWSGSKSYSRYYSPPSKRSNTPIYYYDQYDEATDAVEQHFQPFPLSEVHALTLIVWE